MSTLDQQQILAMIRLQKEQLYTTFWLLTQTEAYHESHNFAVPCFSYKPLLKSAFRKILSPLGRFPARKRSNILCRQSGWVAWWDRARLSRFALGIKTATHVHKSHAGNQKSRSTISRWVSLHNSGRHWNFILFARYFASSAKILCATAGITVNMCGRKREWLMPKTGRKWCVFFRATTRRNTLMRKIMNF